MKIHVHTNKFFRMDNYTLHRPCVLGPIGKYCTCRCCCNSPPPPPHPFRVFANLQGPVSYRYTVHVCTRFCTRDKLSEHTSEKNSLIFDSKCKKFIWEALFWRQSLILSVLNNKPSFYHDCM